MFIDCYGLYDLESFPTTTYVVDIDITTNTLDNILEMLAKYFDNIELVKESNGQAPRSLGDFLKENPSFIG